MRPMVLVSLQDGKRTTLDKDFVLVGRQEICDLRIDHKSVSKHHCILVQRGGKLYLRDLGSTNGSHVNGKRVRRAALKPQDVLGVAGFTFQVAVPGGSDRSVSDNAGTKKLTPEELQRLQQPETSATAPQAEVASPVVQVNALPDEYTPVEENHD